MYSPFSAPDRSPLDCLPQQPLTGPSGDRFVLRSDHTQHPFPTLPAYPGNWFINIAKKNAAEFLRDNCTDYFFYENPGFLGFDESWKWPAVVLMPEEYKLRVGGMSVTCLSQSCDNNSKITGVRGACKVLVLKKAIRACRSP